MRVILIKFQLLKNLFTNIQALSATYQYTYLLFEAPPTLLPTFLVSGKVVRKYLSEKAEERNPKHGSHTYRATGTLQGGTNGRRDSLVTCRVTTYQRNVFEVFLNYKIPYLKTALPHSVLSNQSSHIRGFTSE